MPFPPGKKGAFVALGIVAVAVAILLILAYFLGFAGFVLYAGSDTDFHLH